MKLASTILRKYASIKANYGPKNGLLVSERISFTEPFDLPLLMGGVGSALWFWNRLQRSRPLA